MAKQRVEVTQPSKQVLNSDISIGVCSDEISLGQLKVSKATIDGRPAGFPKSRLRSGEQFAKMMEQ